MESVKIWSVWIFILLLAACAPTTLPATTPTTTADSATAPALNPVTPTQERLFATDPADTKELPANSDAESQEPNINDANQPQIDIDEAVLVYERAGGRKGIGPSIVTWTMYPDGRVVSSDGRSWQILPDDITTLVDNIMDLGFADFKASYVPKDTCCDRATHTITIQQGDEIYQVSVLDSTEGVPAELYQTLDIIGEFLVALPT